MAMTVVRLTDKTAKTVTVRSSSSRGLFDSPDNRVSRALLDLTKAVPAFEEVVDNIEESDDDLSSVIRTLARGGSITIGSGRFELSAD